MRYFFVKLNSFVKRKIIGKKTEETKTNKYVLILPNIFLEQLAYQNI